MHAEMSSVVTDKKEKVSPQPWCYSSMYSMTQMASWFPDSCQQQEGVAGKVQISASMSIGEGDAALQWSLLTTDDADSDRVTLTSSFGAMDKWAATFSLDVDDSDTEQSGGVGLQLAITDTEQSPPKEVLAVDVGLMKALRRRVGKQWIKYGDRLIDMTMRIDDEIKLNGILYSNLDSQDKDMYYMGYTRRLATDTIDEVSADEKDTAEDDSERELSHAYYSSSSPYPTGYPTVYPTNDPTAFPTDFPTYPTPFPTWHPWGCADILQWEVVLPAQGARACTGNWFNTAEKVLYFWKLIPSHIMLYHKKSSFDHVSA
jgi:hypothetical protein